MKRSTNTQLSSSHLISRPDRRPTHLITSPLSQPFSYDKKDKSVSLQHATRCSFFLPLSFDGWHHFCCSCNDAAYIGSNLNFARHSFFPSLGPVCVWARTRSFSRVFKAQEGIGQIFSIHQIRDSSTIKALWEHCPVQHLVFTFFLTVSGVRNTAAALTLRPSCTGHRDGSCPPPLSKEAAVALSQYYSINALDLKSFRRATG